MTLRSRSLIRGLRVADEGCLRPDYYEQKVNLYVRSLSVRLNTDKKKTVIQILNDSGIKNIGAQDCKWTQRSVKTCILSTNRFGHLWFDVTRPPVYYKTKIDLHNQTHDVYHHTIKNMGSLRPRTNSRHK